MFGAQKLGLHGGVNGGHAAANDHHVAAHGHCAEILGLTQICDERDGILDAVSLRTGGAQGVHAAQTDAKKHSIKFVLQAVDIQIAAQGLPGFEGNATDLHQPIHLARSKVIGGFIGGNAELVQPARFGGRIIKGDVMPVHRKPMRAGKTCGACANHGDGFACGCCAGEGVEARLHQRVGGVALQAGIWRINSGMSISVGQAVTQGAS